MKSLLGLIVAAFGLAVSNLSAATHYVSLESTNPLPPYTNWATAAHVIQDAVDAALADDEIVVTNGIYDTGGRAVGTDVLGNRVAVDKPLTLRSVNGPQYTLIEGAKAPGGGNGDGAIRCVYLADGASLSGFTLTNGATSEWQGTFDDLEQSGGGVWCQSTNAVVSNCVVAGNTASWEGGGAYGGTLHNCTLTGNSASFFGGGAYQGTLTNCIITGNSAQFGGGAGGSTLDNCTLTGNSAYDGGGASQGRLNNCVLLNNRATRFSGGADGGTLYNCTLTGNSAQHGGGGASWGTLNNCTLTGNSARYYGGGVAGVTLNNCIVYFNTAATEANYESSTVMNYCCTAPLPASGTGNIHLDPQLASAAHLSAASPCRGGGSAAYATGADIDGEAWATPPSIGCDEYHPGAVLGPLSVGIAAAFTNVVVDYPAELSALIAGRTTASRWEFGDGVMVTNKPYATHAWAAPGDYAVVLRAYNESHPEGVSATVTVHVAAQGLHYVSADSAQPLPPYNSWATAARNIQDAVDVVAVGGTVLVSNGTYTTAGCAVFGTMTNRVAVDKPLTLRSVNGPQFTIIQGRQVPGTTNGDGAIRCVYLADGASLSGFTLTNGATRTNGDSYLEQSGGGLWCESPTAVVSNCVVLGNSAVGGGGAYGGTLNNCVLSGNSAGQSGGGGVYESTLNNCTLTGNSAGDGGGAYGYGGTLNNCTLTGNWASHRGGGAFQGTLNNCTLTGNWASFWGGGACWGRLNNCTLTCNSAGSRGGGVYGGTLNNCIVYFNKAAQSPNYGGDSIVTVHLNYCCTTPLPVPLYQWQEPCVGNISLDPQLASASHLSVFSPCRGAGSAAYATGSDIDGEPWANPPSIGCDEYRAGAVTGPLSVSIMAACTNTAAGFPVNLTALIEGRTTFSVWDFGDGDFVLDQPWTTRAWTAPGDYLVALWAFNETHPEGVNAAVTVHVIPQPVHHVAFDSGNPVPPYLSWATAARNIQEAVDAATVPGALVLVSNGVYTAGGRAVAGTMTNRVAVDKPLMVRSVNGPEFTIIQGFQLPGTANGEGAIRCVYLTNGASLSGFTVTKGATRTDGDGEREQSGGGVWCESPTAVISNCVVAGNSAWSGSGGAHRGTLNNCALTANTVTGDYSEGGGGVSEATLNNCTLTGNSARFGGGAAGGTLNNCTLSGNSAHYGGGAEGSTLNHCTLSGNSADAGGGGAYGSALNHCTLSGNSALGYGGGVAYGTLNHCTLTSNSAQSGGGAANGTLNNCTLTGNSAEYFGGAYGSTLNNCIVYFNTAPNGANYPSPSIYLNYCCTTPQPTYGVGNITNAPLFVDYAGGNLRLHSNSPCINAGLNAYAPGPTDLDGLPRIVNGNVDIGAYEFQGPGSVISYAWLQRYSLPTDGSADATDPDGDGHTTWQEWRCLTDPTNALSVLRLLSASRAGTNVTVSWQSVEGVNYFLERSTNLSATPLFTPLATGILGQPGTTSYTDTNAAPQSPLFYRVGVKSW